MPLPQGTEALTREIDPRDQRIAELEAENQRLKRIRDALITRVESSAAHKPEPYAAFEHSVILAEQVRERTEALNAAMGELKSSNKALNRARDEAETARQRLNDAIESIADGFVLFDHRHRLIQANSRFRSYWRSAGLQVVPGTSIADVKAEAFSSGLIVEEHTDPAAEGSVFLLSNDRWVQMTERPTLEGGLVVLYSDITDVKNTETARREEALAEKTRLLQSTVDNLSQGVVLVNREGYPEIWNDRFLSLIGLRADRMSTERTFAELMAAPEVPLLTPPVQGLDGSRALEEVYRRSDGTVIEIKTHPMPDGGFVNTYTDITERYRYAETLKESERWIRVVTDHVPALIAYVGADLTIQFCNKVYEAWYSPEGEPLLGRPLDQIHSPELYQRLIPRVREALAGQSVTFEFEESNSRGEQRYMLRSYVPNLDSQGAVVGFFVMIRDITDRRRTALALQQAYDNLERRVKERTSALTGLNNQLRQEINERAAVESRLRDAKLEAERANLSKTKFLAAVSHDLLQPLNAARLFTSALLEHSFGPRAESLVRSVSTSLDDVENLLGTLVDISKLDAGVIKPDVTAFDLRDLLNNIAREFRQMAMAEGLELSFVASSAVVRSDSQLLARILRNFLTNAIRYTGKGRILLGCRRRGDKLLLQVWDTGPGIPQDKLTEIFQEFKRIRPAGSPADKGLGLGLAIVDKIARMLGHPVTVASVEGRGSVFSVEVPLGQLEPSKPQQEADLPVMDGGLEGARVWVVDNDRAICSGMATLLEGWGCRVVTAVSLEDLEAQVDLAGSRCDVILADYHLDNDENGVDVVAEVNRRRATEVPVLMITANYSNDLKQHIRSQGYLLMNKPVKPLKLRSALNHLLQRR
ncbi:MAG: NahK/ErcS family hybrid sensor histidine kinase/response regulator [Marinobacter sp.]|uniref:hybrid sensor histidine kinase/response regulator n=1 Tax=Marinobacter sp. TaxID=50741 RepID=UPI00299CD893|nr:NahK/ErcS family hybrid sensor histidine kinase/response regulator [Marinobacter sp.]MDX1633304.1 NahK/ErcS family hybrid sensor histidine kinase/response regulator [Marinobacter sp.]